MGPKVILVDGRAYGQTGELTDRRTMGLWELDISQLNKVQPPYGGLLFSSCGGLKDPLGLEVLLPDKRTDGQTTG